ERGPVAGNARDATRVHALLVEEPDQVVGQGVVPDGGDDGHAAPQAGEPYRDIRARAAEVPREVLDLGQGTALLDRVEVVAHASQHAYVESVGQGCLSRAQRRTCDG